MPVPDVILFHHAQDLTEGVREFTDQLRTAGHQVTVPDLYGGATFDNLDEVGYARQTGFETIIERGQLAGHAGADADPDSARHKGALFFYSCLPTSEFESPWPEGVPVQIHGMDGDEEFVEEGDLDAARALVASVECADLFLYPGDRHLFAYRSLPSYDEGAATLVMQRVLTFLDKIEQ